MFGTIFLALALVVICYKWFKKDAHNRSRLPPGPPSYPLIGSPVIANYPHVIPAFQGLHQQYGRQRWHLVRPIFLPSIWLKCSLLKGQSSPLVWGHTDLLSLVTTKYWKMYLGWTQPVTGHLCGSSLTSTSDSAMGKTPGGLFSGKHFPFRVSFNDKTQETRGKMFDFFVAKTKNGKNKEGSRWESWRTSDTAHRPWKGSFMKRSRRSIASLEKNVTKWYP